MSRADERMGQAMAAASVLRDLYFDMQADPDIDKEALRSVEEACQATRRALRHLGYAKEVPGPSKELVEARTEVLWEAVSFAEGMGLALAPEALRPLVKAARRYKAAESFHG